VPGEGYPEVTQMVGQHSTVIDDFRLNYYNKTGTVGKTNMRMV
jgi:hypothetical protein